MSSQTDTIEQPAWTAQLQKLMNHALALDEETLDRLAALSGKVIGFHFVNTSLTLYLHPGEKGLVFTSHEEQTPDVMIKGTPVNFFSMLSTRDGKQSAMPANMEIIGDIGLAQRFQQIMQDVELDLEEPLSKWVGDTAAFQLGKFMRNTHQFAVNTGKTLAMNVSEYLRFENETLPDDLMVKEFCEGVDTLREDVDRLTQRLQKLETTLANKNNKG